MLRNTKSLIIDQILPNTSKLTTHCIWISL